MRRAYQGIAVLGCTTIAGAAFAGGWVEYNNETSSRSSVSSSLFAGDTQEKDYIWDDLNKDGWIDLVIVRKQPFTSTGKKRNVLLMNEGGVLTDRTVEYASAADDGGQGFLDETNDRDIWLVDVNGDTWLDMVTVTTLTDNQAKTLSHPRIYINLGEVGGEWQGFMYEEARIPQMHPTAGPRFCSVTSGDYDADGDFDLYFGDYDSGGSQIFDYNNKLLINDGNGFFTDESNARLTSTQRLSAFGAASVSMDMNGDGFIDVVKQTALNPPQHIAVTYNSPDNPGFFQPGNGGGYDVVMNEDPYFINVGDLNNDGKPDIAAVNDAVDRYMLQTTVGGDGFANFSTLSFPGSTNGFGGNNFIADLDNDGWQDVIITDVDVDIAGCTRTSDFLRNNGNAPNVSFQSHDGGNIPNNMLQGIHDIAVFDLNNDGWLDLVIGRCSGTQIWMFDSPIALDITYPNGLPTDLVPGETTPFQVQFSAIGAGFVADSGTLHASVNGGEFSETGMVDLGGGLYEASLPAADCGQTVSYYVSGELDNGTTVTDPAGAPSQVYSALAADGFETIVNDDVEGDVSGWAISSSAGLTAGEWEQADPNGTITSGGQTAAPADAADGSLAFVTQNGAPGGSAGSADVDNGTTTLTTPVFSAAEGSTVSFAAWFFCDDAGTANADFLSVDISANGGSTWKNVMSIDTTNAQWQTFSFVASDEVEVSDNMLLRFVTSDDPNNSITEAGIDSFVVENIVCGDECTGDFNDDGTVDGADLGLLLGAWGSNNADFDVNGDGTVDGADLGLVLGAWGGC